MSCHADVMGDGKAMLQNLGPVCDIKHTVPFCANVCGIKIDDVSPLPYLPRDMMAKVSPPTPPHP